MPTGVATQDHARFQKIVTELRKNGLADETIAKAIGYRSTGGLQAVMRGDSPPTRSKVETLEAFASTRILTTSMIPTTLDQALLMLTAVWYYLDTAQSEVGPMLKEGYAASADKLSEVVEYMTGRPADEKVEKDGVLGLGETT